MFKRTARGSRYERRTLVEEFKRGINSTIRYKLIEAEQFFLGINKWFDKIINLEEREQEKKGKNEREKKDSDTKAKYLSKYWRSTIVTVATILSMAKKVGLLVGTNKIYSNRESR